MEIDYYKAVELFYNNEKVREQFNYWDIDGAIATIDTFISDVAKICEEEGINEL